MKRFAALFLALLLLVCSAASAEEATRRVYMKGEVPDIPQEDVLVELYVAPTVGCDGMLLLSGGMSMAVDTCTEGQYPRLRSIMAEQGVTCVDYAFITHPDYDHIGGVPKMIENGEIASMMTAYPENYADYPCMQVSVVKKLKKADIPIITVADGDVIDFGKVKLTVLRQGKIKTSTNQLSAMLMVEAGDCRMLLTGDAENMAQKYYVNNGYDLKADIMKYPHHGVSHIEDTFIDAVAPEAVFITHSYNDSTPSHRDLEKRGIGYGVTSLGVIHIVTNGEYWIIEHLVSDEQIHLLDRYNLAF